MEDNCEPLKSQFQLIDDSIQLSFVSSKSKSHKYFTRKPISQHNIRIKDSAKKRGNHSSEFSGFYSPTQKQDALIKKSLIQRALNRSPVMKASFCSNNQDSTNQSVEICPKQKNTFFRNKSPNHMQIIDKSFKKKKTLVEDLISNKNKSKQKQNPDINDQQLEIIKLENKRLKEEIVVLLQYKNKTQRLIEQQNCLKIFISQLENKIQTLQDTNRSLQTDLKQINSIQLQVQALDSVHFQTVKQLNELNISLKKQIIDLQDKIKYAGIEISMLKMKCPDQNMSKIIEERNNLRYKNKQLRIEVIRLKTKAREAELFELTPENTAREFY